MAGSTLCIIGYSAIGRRLAEIMQALGATVLVADPHAEIDRHGITLRPLPELLAQVEIIVCLAVASPQTENLLDEAAQGRMRRGALLINASRGELVDEEALSRAFGQRAVQCWILGEILIDIDPREPVNCDRQHVGQLLSNLLGNAFVYGTPTVPIRIRARPE